MLQAVQRLNVQAPVYETSGYASAARSFVLALANQAPLPLRLSPLRWNSGAFANISREDYLRLHTLSPLRPAIPSCTGVWLLSSRAVRGTNKPSDTAFLRPIA